MLQGQFLGTPRQSDIAFRRLPVVVVVAVVVVYQIETT